MLHKVTLRVLAVAACAWVACDAGALTLGRAHGAVLIGRPLELAIPVSLDQHDDEPCASADVFYGEERLRQAPSVRWQPGTAGQGVLHVSSPVPVSEPMVTVYLRVGCGQATTRRFVMLAELPPGNEPAAPLVRSAPAAVQPPTVSAPATAPTPGVAAQAPAANALPSAAAPAGPRRRVPTPADAAVAALKAERATAVARATPRAPAAAPVPRARKPQADRPRLKLEPIELGPEGDPVLRLSTELNSPLATDPQKRQEAAALWAALQKGPDEILQDALRLLSVQREVDMLRRTTQQNAAAVAQMRAQVERAHAERGTAAVLVALLSAVLAALVGWLGWRWYAAARLQRVGRWFEQHGDSALAPHTMAGPPSVPTVPNPAAAREAVATPAAAGVAAAAAAAAASAPVVRAPAPRSAPAPTSPEEFQASRGSSRLVGVEELIDVHDKADFFLSIGEVDQAVSVLEAHVHDQVETSALAWMDLLELYHSTGKRAEYERLRSEFRQRFTAHVPDFEHFDQPSATLENYSRALGRIVALWPSRRVLDVIEESIFRKPGLPGSDPFSLEAYRELVLLYHVARELPQQEGRDAAPSRFHDTSLQPLNMPERAEPVAATEHDRLLIPPASARLGVDIDIGELTPQAGEPLAQEVQALQAEQHGGRELPALDFDLDDPADAAAGDSGSKR